PPTDFYTLSLHDALPILSGQRFRNPRWPEPPRCRIRSCTVSTRRKLWTRQICTKRRSASTCRLLGPSRLASAWTWGCSLVRRLRSEEHTSELQSRFDLVC